MDCFISEIQIPEDCDGLFWTYCQNCRNKKTCPYIYDQILRQAACHGHAAARSLKAEAERQKETISCAEDLCLLLESDEDLERALSYALNSEMTVINDLRAKVAKHIP